MKRSKLFQSLFLFSLMIIFTGCFENVGKKGAKRIEKQIKEFNKIFDEVTSIVDVESEEWRKLLESTTGSVQTQLGDLSDEWLEQSNEFSTTFSDLEEDVSGLLDELRILHAELPGFLQLASYDINRLVSSSLSTGTASFFCATDVLKEDLSNALKRIDSRLDLIGKTYGGVEELFYKPTICNLSASSIDLSLPSNYRSTLSINGFNFPEANVLDVVLVRDDGFEESVQQQVVFMTSHNQYTLNLSGFSDDYLALFFKLSIRCSGTPLSELPILPA